MDTLQVSASLDMRVRLFLHIAHGKYFFGTLNRFAPQPPGEPRICVLERKAERPANGLKRWRSCIFNPSGISACFVQPEGGGSSNLAGLTMTDVGSVMVRRATGLGH